MATRAHTDTHTTTVTHIYPFPLPTSSFPTTSLPRPPPPLCARYTVGPQRRRGGPRRGTRRPKKASGQKSKNHSGVIALVTPTPLPFPRKEWRTGGGGRERRKRWGNYAKIVTSMDSRRKADFAGATLLNCQVTDRLLTSKAPISLLIIIITTSWKAGRKLD